MDDPNPASWRRRTAGESLRLFLLLAVAVWLTSPFLTRSLIGGGDAVWYHHQIADAVTQFRAGEFPVFVGQTHASFNGAVHPIRTAPYCQYFAGLIDWVTGQSLGFHTLLHLTAMLSLIGASVVTYFALCWLAPHARWRAAVLAWVYGSTPGVVGLPFAQDLYMSTMTAPWVPLVFAATVQTWRRSSRGAPVVLGAALAALWWAHSPVALWTTLGVGMVFLVQGISGWRSPAALRSWSKRAALAGVALGLLGSYPVVSVLLLRAPGERIVPRVFDRPLLLSEIQGAFPNLLLPLNSARPLLTWLQPGYAVLLALAIAWWVAFRLNDERRRAVQVLLICALGYLLLILPVPGFTAWVWLHLPEMAVSMTNIWPMQRLVIIIAAISVVAVHVALPPWRGAGRGAPAVGRVLMVAALIWSTWEAQKLRDLAQQRTRPEVETVQLAREENINVSEYAYQQLPQRPAHFIHGVRDPGMEVRFLDPESESVLISNKEAVENAATEPWQALQPVPQPNPGLIAFDPVLMLEPGRRYLLTFEFADRELRGVLRLVGTQLHRVYPLPAAGDATGFGTGPEQEKSLTVWTSRTDGPETVRLEFIPEPRVGEKAPTGSLGRVRLTPIDQKELPVEVVSLLPLQMHVRTPTEAVLETMRVFIPGWTARVNGQPVLVKRSADGLVALDVPAGESTVEVSYRGPWLLRFVFWLNLGGWLLAITGGGAVGIRNGYNWRSERADRGSGDPGRA